MTGEGEKIYRRRSGFTIMELLMVIALIGILTAAGWGVYTGSFRGMSVKKSARDFVLSAQYARIMAIEKGREYRIEIDGSNNRFAVVCDEYNEVSGKSEAVVANDVYCRPVEFEGDVKFESIKIERKAAEPGGGDGDSETIVFSPDGTAAGAVIQIGNGSSHYTANISGTSGRVKLYDGKADKVESDSFDLDTEFK